LTQVEAAKQLGVSQPEIAKMELGTRRLTYLDAVDLTRLYGATISDLLPSDYLDVHAAPSTAERTRSRAR
jgi:transcriptional regulator with XRE-family HTH domain